MTTYLPASSMQDDHSGSNPSSSGKTGLEEKDTPTSQKLLIPQSQDRDSSPMV